jgi:PleD family two-component response regulator
VSGWTRPSASADSAVAERALIQTMSSALKILVADDNRINLKVASRLLEKRGHKVT